MSNANTFRELMEKVQAESIVSYVPLPVKSSQLDPVLSEQSVKLHHDKLYKNYVTKSLAGEGEFQTAGAVLHKLFFEQFTEPSRSNKPFDTSLELITKKFGDFSKFKTEFTEIALTLHGSGWVYMDTRGSIKTIQNHKIVDNVAVIIDLWEHAYILDYMADKEKYLSKIWEIINWDIVNLRIDAHV